MKIVAHFVRKKGQFNAPFISNQIKYLSDFEPIIFYRTSKLIKSKKTAHFGGFSTLELLKENLITFLKHCLITIGN